MRIAGLSGWGQPHDALSTLAPDATHISYADYAGADEAIAHIAEQAHSHNIVIGWSLGGQLAVRAVARGLVKPELLVLIATPYQFVAQPHLKLGMPRSVFDKFRDNYGENPHKTLQKAWELIHKDDINAENVLIHLKKHDKEAIKQQKWHEWLHHLDHFSCDNLSFSEFPPTLILHGTRDHVVRAEQSAYFMKAIPHATLITLEGCGHAPHWHDRAGINAAIKTMHPGYPHV